MRKPIFWIIGIFAAIILMLFVCSKVTTIIRADSIQGRTDAGTVTLNNDRDSAVVVFSYPDNNAYDSMTFYPRWDSVTADRFLISLDDIELDSVGCHAVIVRGYGSNNTWLDTLQAQWCNFGAIIAEPGTGFRTYPCTLEVLQTTDSSATADVNVVIRPLGGGRPFVMWLTDSNGLLVYKSEAESISVFLHKVGETTNAEDTLVITGSQTDSLYSTTIVPPAPAADMVTISMGLITANFDTLNPSYVWWRPVKSTGKEYKKSDELYYGTGVNALAIQKQWTIETSSTSTFSFSVFANENLSDTLSQYEFWFYWADGRITQKITAVPDQDSFNPIGQ